MEIPLNDLKRQHDPLRSELEALTRKVIASGWFILGSEVENFEREFAAYCGAAHGITVGSGTDALEIALRALDLGSGAEVATVANAGFYGSVAILATGATPLYIDVHAADLTMDPAGLDARLTANTQAVIVTHLYGKMADMPALLAVARQRGIPVIEDCAQAHGAELKGKKAGTWGDLSCFSFYPSKNLGALGDGGAILTNREDLAKRVRLLRQYGWSSRYRNDIEGAKCSRLDELQAAYLRLKLKYLDGWNGSRRRIGRFFDAELKGLEFGLPGVGDSHVCHLYVLRVKNRDIFRAKLAEKGVQTDTHYPVPDHKQNVVRGAAFAQCRLPVTEALAEEVVTLPCFPELSKPETDFIVGVIKSL